MRTFFQELKRRRVYRAALAYAIAASATVQLLGTLLPAFHAPDWILQGSLLLLALGFPLALVLGWAFELQDGSVRKTPTGQATPAANRRRLAVLMGAGLLLAALALSAYWVWHPWTRTPSVAGLSLPGTAHAPAVPEKSVAVIPFENLSDNKENSFFAVGVQDEILTDLAKVKALRVISRTSVQQYGPGGRRNLREIGRALGVAYILEGSVQRDGQRVRLSAQLIDTRTDTHVWAETYDRDVKDLLTLQSDLAKTIAAQLEATLSPAERAAIETQPTSDPIARDLYLRANALISGPLFNVAGTEDLFRAADLLEQAVARDPDYFLAWCLLARAQDQIYFTGPDHTPARLALAEKAVRQAQQLRPDAGETHLALAEHFYCGSLAYDEARRELQLAARTLPNVPEIFMLAGFIDRRQGRWEASTKNFSEALRLDPRNTYNLQQLAVSYQFERRFAEAATALDLAREILPNDPGLQVARAAIDFHQRADSKPMHAAIAKIVAQDPNAAFGLADEWLTLALCERDSVAADHALAALSREGYTNEGILFPRAWCAALVARVRGDAPAAQAAFTSARGEVARTLREEPNQAQSLCVLGMIDAALGHKEDALRESRLAAELLPIAKESINGGLVAEYLAVTYAWVGEKEAALAQLRVVTRIPSEVSYGLLRLHPFWDTLRGDPRFTDIMASLAPEAAP